MMKASGYRGKTMFRRKYRYFISYSFRSLEGKVGIGQCELLSATKIKTYEDIMCIVKAIEDDNINAKKDSVIILNYKRLKG